MHQKFTMIILAAAALLAGCSKPAAPVTTPAVVVTPPSALVDWEYRVEKFDLSDLPDHIAISKNKLADAQHDLALATIQKDVAFGTITAAQVDDSNADATADMEIKMDNNESEREDSIQTNLVAYLNSQADWQFCSVVPMPPQTSKVLVVFKRPKR